MNPGEVRGLLSVIENPRDKAMVLMLLRTGLRVGELLKLKVDDLNLETQTIFISEGAKNGVDRVVHISDDARDALVMWLEERDSNKECLFYAAGRAGFTDGGVRAMFRKYLAKANLSNKRYSLHSLRHTFASDLLNAGMEPEFLQLLLGHKCIESTYRYARLTDKTREREYFRAMSIIEGEED
jgi:site-specific recombinase XerD